MPPSTPLAFLAGSAGTGEWIVLFIVILVVVGPKRLPEVARKLGRYMEMFRRAADEFKDQIMSLDQEPPRYPPPSEGMNDPHEGGDADYNDDSSYHDNHNEWESPYGTETGEYDSEGNNHLPTEAEDTVTNTTAPPEESAPDRENSEETPPLPEETA